MKILLVTAMLSALAFPVVAQARYTQVAQAIQRDLEAIPPGSQPTDAQIQSLASDLDRIFRKVNSPPTVTLNYVAGKLADAVAQGEFLAGDLQAVAMNITDIASSVISIAGQGSYDKTRAARLESILTKAGIEQPVARQLVAGILALPFSGRSYTIGDTRLVSLQPDDRSVPRYKHASGNVEIDTILGPAAHHSGGTDPYYLSQGVTVELAQVPLGKYHVSVTIGSNPQPVELGLIRVRPGSLISETATAAGNAASTRARSGRVSFGNFYGGPTLPDGFSVDDITAVTVTDEQGITRLHASFVAADATPLTSGHDVQGHLTATAAAPTAAGTVSAVIVNDAGIRSQNGSLLFLAVGLPANATLTFSINGAAVEPVTTGPTGNLYVKTSKAVFPEPPEITEVVNSLPDTVDLFTATAFAVSDAQGNVLLNSSSAQ